MSDFQEAPATPHFTPAELRVLGALVEKKATSAEAYPLTLNALVLACNQKTSREPISNHTPGEVGQALRALEQRGLARLQMGSRADRWEHCLEKGLELTPPQVALMSLMFLRGPQTPNELVTRSQRVYAFDDTEQAVHQLERLISRGLAVLIGRQPGQREDRYTHALGDLADAEAILQARGSAAGAASPAQERLDALEARVAELEARLAQAGL